MIDWKQAQLRLGSAAGPVDGIPGPATFLALMCYTARRQPSTSLRMIAREMARLLPNSGIMDKPERLAEFLAQTCHESAGWSSLEENLRYSAKRLMAVWPRRFPTLASARPYAWDPSDPDREDVRLANLIYGGRMGNEDDGTDDNDGWDYRGRGILQHTGADEYDQLKHRLGLTPDQVAEPAGAVAAAIDYWLRRKVNDPVDKNDFKASRKAVNGGHIGLTEVAALRERALKILR